MGTNYELIDGIKCYAPALSASNTHYPQEMFQRLVSIEDSHFWFQARNRVITYLIRRYNVNADHRKFLEIGCGTGVVMKHLHNHTNLQLNGAEIYLEGLRYAKMRLPQIEFVQLDAKKIPFNNTYDCIGMFDVLEHIDDDQLVIRNVKNALKNQGLFFISVPQYKWMWSKADDDAFHQRRYSRNELRRKLSESGFSILYLGSFVFLLFPFMILSRFMSILGKKKEKSSELQINKPLNFLFRQVMRLEWWLIKSGIQLPFGGSIFCVAKKTDC